MPSIFSSAVAAPRPLGKFSLPSAAASPTSPATVKKFQTSPVSIATTVLASSPSRHTFSSSDVPSSAASSSSAPLSAAFPRSATSGASGEFNQFSQGYFAQANRPMKSKKSLSAALADSVNMKIPEVSSASAGQPALFRGMKIGEGTRLVETDEEFLVLVPTTKIVTTTTTTTTRGPVEEKLKILQRSEQPKPETPIAPPADLALEAHSETRRLLAMERAHLQSEAQRLEERQAAFVAQQTRWAAQQREFQSEERRAMKAKFVSEIDALKHSLRAQNSAFQQEVAEIGQEYQKSREQGRKLFEKERKEWKLQMDQLKHHNKELESKNQLEWSEQRQRWAISQSQWAEERANYEKQIEALKKRVEILQLKLEAREDAEKVAKVDSQAAVETSATPAVAQAKNSPQKLNERESVLEQRESMLDLLENELRARLAGLVVREEGVHHEEAKTETGRLANSALMKRLKAWENDLISLQNALHEKESALRLRERNLADYMAPFNESFKSARFSSRKSPNLQAAKGTPEFSNTLRGAVPPSFNFVSPNRSLSALWHSLQSPVDFAVGTPSAQPVRQNSPAAGTPYSAPLNLFNENESFSFSS